MLFDKGFYDWSDYIDQAYMDLCGTQLADCPNYPIKYLNDALLGMMKSELILVGADSGCGKTEIANQIAYHNAGKGKNVYLFSLEGDRYEVAQRERYRQFCNIVISNKLHLDLDYRKFIMNEYEKEFKNKPASFHEEMMSIDDMIKAKYKTLKVFRRDTQLTKELITGYFDLIKDDADLIVLDHLHYFDFLTSNEHSEISEIMKVIKKKQEEIRVPIILISHLRKKSADRSFPGNEEFHGSSNIYKQANTCILFSHIIEKEEDYYEQVEKGLYKTGIRVTKSRTGIPTTLIGAVNFNNRTKKYEEEYKIAITYDHSISFLEEKRYPKWAKRTPEYKPSYGGAYD